MHVQGHDGTTVYDGGIDIRGQWYTMGPNTALSQLFFRVMDVNGTQRFYTDPDAYFVATNPAPEAGGDDNSDDTTMWATRRSAFNARFEKDFYASQADILADPEAHIARCQEASQGKVVKAPQP